MLFGIAVNHLKQTAIKHIWLQQDLIQRVFVFFFFLIFYSLREIGTIGFKSNFGGNESFILERTKKNYENLIYGHGSF